MPELGEDLSRLFRQVAESAPASKPGPTLVGDVERRYGRRRGTLNTAVAAAAVLAVLFGGIGAVRVLQGDRKPSDAATGAPAAEVWSPPIRHVPVKLPDGRKYNFAGLLPDGRILVSTLGGLEKVDAIWAWDPDRGTVQKVVTPEDRPEGRAYTQMIVVGDRWAAWSVDYLDEQANTRRSELWVMSTTDLAPRRVAVSTGVPFFDLSLSDDLVHWRGPQGIGEVALPDGKPRTVPGTKGYGVVQWPWIGTPAPDTAEAEGKLVFGTQRNLTTGQTRTAVSRGSGECSASWCAFGGKPYTTSRFDGSERRTYPGVIESPGMDGGVLRDRFLLVQPNMGTPKAQLVLVDLQRDRKTVLGPVVKDATGNVSANRWTSDQFIAWGDDNAAPTEYLVLDLSAIE